MSIPQLSLKYLNIMLLSTNMFATAQVSLIVIVT